MKPFSFFLFIFGLVMAMHAEGGRMYVPFELTPTEATEVKQQLAEYEQGKVTLEKFTEKAEWNGKLLSYYFGHSNEFSLKTTLPVARCFALNGFYEQAADMAQKYANTYSNDWHGWKIFGGASALLGNRPEQALYGLTNSAALGDDGSYAPAALNAIHLERLDVVSNMIPQLLVLKSHPETADIKPMDVLKALVLYALKTGQGDIFFKAMEGADLNKIQAEDDLKQFVTDACKKFDSKDAAKICEQLSIPAAEHPAGPNSKPK